MELKHTPGPWELDPPETAHVTDEDYHAIRAGCGFWAIAKDQREPGFSIAGHMSAADARLMNAAPELLEALREVLKHEKWHAAMADEVTDEAKAAIKGADAAIAKATGSKA